MENWFRPKLPNIFVAFKFEIQKMIPKSKMVYIIVKSSMQ